MKRDWNVIKDLLNELEPLHQYNGLHLQVYYLGENKSAEYEIHKMEMARLLIEKNYIKGNISRTIAPGGFSEISNMNLTFDGYDLLEKLNDDTLWKKIKGIAKDKGIEVTFTTLGALTTQAIQSIFS
jgi:hypothetical protein